MKFTPSARTAPADARTSAETIDRAKIFSTILKRQALRREAKLPLLEVRAEYKRAVEQATWLAHVRAHHVRVREEILEELRTRHGPQFGGSMGGLWVIRLLTSKRLQAMFDSKR